MPSYTIEEAFRYCKLSMLRNAISPRFLCNSGRFSRISEEIDSEKSLRIIFDNCPLETTKYFRRLIFSRYPNYEILPNCIQLTDLTISKKYDWEPLSNLPVTLQKLKITNAIQWHELWLLPRNLIELDCDIGEDFVFDINCFPKLKSLTITGRSKVIFQNCENHDLKHLFLNVTDVSNCNFPDLHSLRINNSLNISKIYHETLKKVRHVRFGNFSSSLCTNLENIETLSFSEYREGKFSIYKFPYLRKVEFFGTRGNLSNVSVNIKRVNLERIKKELLNAFEQKVSSSELIDEKTSIYQGCLGLTQTFLIKFEVFGEITLILHNM